MVTARHAKVAGAHLYTIADPQAMIVVRVGRDAVAAGEASAVVSVWHAMRSAGIVDRSDNVLEAVRVRAVSIVDILRMQADLPHAAQRRDARA